MIDIQYTLSRDQSSMKELDLVTCSPTDLHYYAFVGDINYKINDVDFSAEWDWVPTLHFGIELCFIVDDLLKSGKGKYDYTESEATINYIYINGMVEITANYAEGVAIVPYHELKEASRDFLTRLLKDLLVKAPDLSKNIHICEVIEKFSIRNLERP